MSKATKTDYVLTTYRMIQEEGPESVNVKKIVARLGCTPGALYKHFDSLDHLMQVAGIRFLREYNQRLEPLARQTSTIYSNVKAWKEFIDCAFQRPKLYFDLFYQIPPERFAQYLNEYCELFPEDYFALNEVQRGIVLRESLEERDYIAIKESIGKEIPDDACARYIARVDNYIVRGYLQEATTADIGQRKILAKQCYELLKEHLAVTIGKDYFQ